MPKKAYLGLPGLIYWNAMGLASPNPNRIGFKKVYGFVHLPDGAPESWTAKRHRVTTAIIYLEVFSIRQRKPTILAFRVTLIQICTSRHPSRNQKWLSQVI